MLPALEVMATTLLPGKPQIHSLPWSTRGDSNNEVSENCRLRLSASAAAVLVRLNLGGTSDCRPDHDIIGNDTMQLDEHKLQCEAQCVLQDFPYDKVEDHACSDQPPSFYIEDASETSGALNSITFQSAHGPEKEKHQPVKILGNADTKNIERSWIAAPEDDPCSGLTDYIKKSRERKRYACLRCGSVLEKAIYCDSGSPTSCDNSQQFSFSRSISWPEKTSSKFLLNKKCPDKQEHICNKCGKRYTNTTSCKRRKRSYYARRISSVRRAITWPLPMDCIVEEVEDAWTSAHHEDDNQ